MDCGAHNGLQADLHFVFFDLHFKRTILGSCTVCRSTSKNMGRNQLSVDELRNARQEAQSAYLSDIHPNHCEKSAAGYILSSSYGENDKLLTCRSVFLYKLMLANILVKVYLLVSSSLREGL